MSYKYSYIYPTTKNVMLLLKRKYKKYNPKKVGSFNQNNVLLSSVGIMIVNRDVFNYFNNFYKLNLY